MISSKPRILAIDDTPANLFTLGSALADDFDLQIATSGAMGLLLALQSLPDLILLDIMMPEMDGFETCRRLKADHRLADIPVIFVTALHELQSEVMGLELGAQDYITKPIQVETARQRIRNLLEREHLRKQVLLQRDQLEAEVREHEKTQALLRRLSVAIEQSPASVVITDLDARIQYVNPRFTAVTGFSPQEAIGQNARILQSGQTAKEVYPELWAKVTAGEVWQGELLNKRKNGELYWEECQIAPVRDASGSVTNYVAVKADITERKKAEEKLRLAANVFTFAREGIMITDANGTIVDVNTTFTRITGYSRDEAVGRNPRILKSGRQEPEQYAAMWKSLVEKGHWYGEVWNRRKSGEIYAEMQSVSAVRDAAGKTQHYVALFSDITSNKEHERQLEHIAHYDALTHLPNRVLLADRLRQAVIQSQRRQHSLAVVFLDLDGFKRVNDSHGHDVGNALLITLAQRIKEAMREGDTLARIGGDEFVAVLTDLEGLQDCESVLARMLLAASQPMTVGQAVISVSASMGVTLFPQDGVDADMLMRHADQAMYVAKHDGKNRYHMFDVVKDAAIKTHRESLERIRSGLTDREFVLHYQPKINMKTGQVTGAEALIRWQHPKLGLLSPASFLPVIEDHAISIEVGEWVIRTAMAQMSRWQQAGLSMPVSVNVGARQLQQENFPDRLAGILAEYPQVPAQHLQLEVLETSALEDMDKVGRVMQACHSQGLGFALDDFGTGYSSLTYLKQLPAQTLKIDQSFVRDMREGTNDLAIVIGIIGLARAFGREVIAEGVETAAHGALLLSLNCELVQGFGIARPMPADDLPGWVRQWQATPVWTA